MFGSGRDTAGARYVHQIAWRATHDWQHVPVGYEVDHLCFVRDCCNPAHLEAITLAENRRRRRPRPKHVRVARPLPSGSCRHGHPWADNGRLNTQLCWICLECSRAAGRRNDAKRMIQRAERRAALGRTAHDETSS